MTLRTFTPRSRLLALTGGLLTMGGRGVSALTVPTPRQTSGPYYLVQKPDDSDLDLTRVAGRAARAKGRPIEVHGTVVDARRGPLGGATIEIWQADWQGHYHHPSDRSGEADPDFQGFGALRVGTDGTYRFHTVMPKFYGQGRGARTPHIHVRVFRPQGGDLVTQMYFPGEPMNERDAIFQSLGDPVQRAAVTAVAEAGEPPRYRFDIVVAG